MPSRLKLAIAATALALSPVMSGTAAAEDLKVVASFSIIADLARNVGGDRVEITTLVGPNGDAHVYEPRPADAAAFGGADVILVNGLQFEGFLQRLVEASGTSAPVVEVASGAERLAGTDEAPHEDHAQPVEGSGHDHHADQASHDHAAEAHAHEGHQHGAFDPHAWQSVHNAEVYVKNIADAFCAADAAGCDVYRANAATYGAALEALDGEIRAAVASIPQDRRTIITSHDAYRYFEHEYGIRFLAPEGVSTESEASAADVAALIRQVRQDSASAIFVETITNPRLVEQIAAETGLRIGGSLHSDALTETDGPASTYIDMMRHNITTIKGAVLGS